MLKSCGWVGARVLCGGARVYVVAHEILETAQSPNSLFGFGACTLDWDLDSGLSIV